MTIYKLTMRSLSGKTIPHPSFVSSLECRHSKYQTLPCQPPKPFFSFAKDVLGVEQLTEECPHEISEYLTHMESSQEKRMHYFPPFFSLPFKPLGIKLGNFRTRPLINIDFQVITNSTEPEPDPFPGEK